jgi:hypothetical protein
MQSHVSLPADGNGNAWAAVELGPSLPMAAYTSVEPWHHERIGALALYCSDGRWGEAFDDFCHRHLHIPRYDRWAVPGGPAWLIHRDSDEDLFSSIRKQLDFLVRVHELERMVLITHFGCAFYGEMLHASGHDCLGAQLNDLQVAAKSLYEWYPQMAVETYLAMQRGRCLSFHAVRSDRIHAVGQGR